jgi:hypothetical protein
MVGGPELAFRKHYVDEQTGEALTDVILVRFAFEHDFGLYLSYPYLFMHECAAHMFAFDHTNERFNDGWLLHAASHFLYRRGWELDIEPLLIPEQINAFYEHRYGMLRGIPRRACSFTRDFEKWLRDEQRFKSMTWELAAFEPRAGESEFWPTQFINRLEQAFNTDRRALRRKIEAARDLRALFEMLAPV